MNYEISYEILFKFDKRDRMKTIKLLKIIGVVLSLNFLSCAKEVSDEDRRREEADRELKRLTAAEGHFPGFIEMDETRGVPFMLDVLTKRNPQAGNDSPTLDVTMTLGFFGGVSLVAQRANYDWGSGKLTAVFAKAGGAPGAEGSNPLAAGNTGPNSSNTIEIELTGLSEQKSFAQGTVKGSRLGQKSLLSLKSDPITHGVNDFSYPMVFSLGAETQTAILNLKRLNVDLKAPSSSDMPSLPPLQSSLRFSRTANISQDATVTWFDPLAGTLDLQLRANSWVRVENIFAPIDRSQEPSVSLADIKNMEYSGSIYVGGRATYGAKLNLDSARLGLAEYAPQSLMSYYVGTYKGSETGLPLKSFAVLTDTGATIQNPEDLSMPSIPRLQMKLVRCIDGQPISTYTVNTFSIDYLAGEMRFVDASGTSRNVTTIKVSQGWMQFDGTIVNQDSSTGSARNPVFSLRATQDQSKEPNCSKL